MIRRRTVLFAFLAVLFGLTLSFALLELTLRFLPVSDILVTLPVNSENPYLRFPENRDITWSRGANFSIVTRKHVNNYGFLNDHDYDPADESPLLAIIGDSYVEAAQVENVAAMHGVLAAKIGSAGRVYSFGSSGSPLSNYLAYAEYATREFAADALVFIIVGNDFDESLTKYKDAPGMHYFSDAAGHLDLVRIDFQPTLIGRLARQSALFRYVVANLRLNRQSLDNLLRSDEDVAEQRYVGNTPADFDASRLADSIGVIDRFFVELPRQTGLTSNRIAFVLDGMRPHLYDKTSLGAAQGSYFDLMRKYFAGAALNNGYEVIDLQPVFIREHASSGVRFEFSDDGHWNESGHALVAEEIGQSSVYQSLFAR